MRNHFELCCKVIGLLLVCYGIITLFVGVPWLIHLYRLQDMAPQSAGVQWYPHLFLLWIVLSCGALPVSMGIYLMRSNNLVVRLCYPDRTRHIHQPTSGTLSLDLSTRDRQPDPAPETAEDKYAPPGYFQ